ncbi:hypothetical protein Tco_0431166 [Tanacetum coccineum]
MKRTRQPQQESTVVRGKLPRGRNDFEESSLRLLERKAYPIFWHKFAHKSFTVFQMDVKTAFLHGTLKEDMYVCQPEAALKCRDWEMTFSLVQNTSYQSPCGIFINQSKYVLEIHKKYGMKSCDPIGTPVEIKDKLDHDQHGSPVDATKYHSMIGALMYLTSSRPDIVHATCLCARYQAKTTEKNLKEVKRIFCYLQGTVNTGLWYTKDSGFELIGFSDADYAGCKDSFKSTSGGAQFLGEKLIPIYCDSKLAIAISCNPVLDTQNETHRFPRTTFQKGARRKGGKGGLRDSIRIKLVSTGYWSNGPVYANESTYQQKKYFKSLSLDELRSPDFNLLFDEEYSEEEEEEEAMAETMEQYMSKTRIDYGSGVSRPKIDDKDQFELNGQFLKEL